MTDANMPEEIWLTDDTFGYLDPDIFREIGKPLHKFIRADRYGELQHKLDIANDMHAGAVMVIKQLEARVAELEGKHLLLSEDLKCANEVIDIDRDRFRAQIEAYATNSSCREGGIRNDPTQEHRGREMVKQSRGYIL